MSATNALLTGKVIQTLDTLLDRNSKRILWGSLVFDTQASGITTEYDPIIAAMFGANVSQSHAILLTAIETTMRNIPIMGVQTATMAEGQDTTDPDEYTIRGPLLRIKGVRERHTKRVIDNRTRIYWTDDKQEDQVTVVGTYGLATSDALMNRFPFDVLVIDPIFVHNEGYFYRSENIRKQLPPQLADDGLPPYAALSFVESSINRIPVVIHSRFPAGNPLLETLCRRLAIRDFIYHEITQRYPNIAAQGLLKYAGQR